MIRVVHCPADVGSHPSCLAAAERELGLDSRLVTLESRGVRRELERVRLLAALGRADVAHFNFGSSALPQWYPTASAPARAYARLLELRDLPLLRRAGKRIFVTYQGDDVRTGDRARHAEAVDDYRAPHDARKRWAARRFDRYADGIYALNPDLLALLPARATFLPYASVDPATWRPAPPGVEGPLRVAHAPSDRAVKGTVHVVDAVQRLRDEGVAIELDLIEGAPREAVRERLARADLVVDQLLTGWYGGVAVEAMALGKPVVAHLDAADLAASGLDDVPIVDATPTTIGEVLRAFAVERRSEVVALGEQSRAFAERRHDPRRIAERVVADYERALAAR